MSLDFDIRASGFGRCAKRHLPRDTRLVLLVISPDGNGYCLANLPDDEQASERFLTDFSAKFNFYQLPKLKLIQIIT
jgi:hypothetical protein